MPAKAKKGEGCPPAELSKMLGVLKYQAEHGKKADKKDDAQKALSVYKELSDPSARQRFLQEFESSGHGKGPNSLKFALSFKKTVSDEKKTNISSVEDWFTRLEHM